MNSTEVDEYEYDDDYDDYDDDYEDEYKDKKKDEKKDKKGGWFSNCIGCIVFIPGMTISLMIASAILKVVVWVIDGILALIFVLIGEVFRYLSTILAIA